jgi:hypothetical protein
MKFLHSANVVAVLHAPDTVHSPAYTFLFHVVFVALATVATCIKNLASAIGHVGSGEAVVPAGHAALSAVVFDCKQISCVKNAPVAVALATVTLFNFKVDANLGTTTMCDAECCVPEVTDVELSEISACKPTA